VTAFDVADVAGRNTDLLGERLLRKVERLADRCEVHTLTSHNASKKGSPYPRNNVVETKGGKSHPVRMGKKSTKAAANHLRAWRELAGLTQDQLAELVGTAGNVIGLLEAGQRGLSDKWLRKLAPHLGTTPGFLLDHHPDDMNNDLFDVWGRIPDDRKSEAREMLEVIAKRRA